MSRTNRGPYPPGYPAQGYPPGAYGQQYGQQPYGQYPHRGGSKVGYLLMGLLAAGLGIVVIILAVSFFSANETASAAVMENNKLKLENRTLSDRNRGLENQIATLGARPIGADPKVMGGEGSCPRCKVLERELHAMEREAQMLRSRLPAGDLEKMKGEEDIGVEDLKVERLGNDQMKASFKVVNRSGYVANNVQGSIRFWDNQQIVYEKPFLVPRLEPQSSVDINFIAPIGNASSWGGYVKTSGSY